MAALHRVEGVDTVVDVDLVAAAAQGLAETIDVGGIAAEAMRAEECRDHADFHGDLHVARRLVPDRSASCGSLVRASSTCHRPQHPPPQLSVAQAAQCHPDG